LEAIGVRKKGLRLRLEKAALHLPPLNIRVDVPVRIVCMRVCVVGRPGDEGTQHSTQYCTLERKQYSGYTSKHEIVY
jgi:hypothetical protein